jgi:FtsP/CotA-like multicopper oxidase with cupredoxin domain
MIGRRSLFKSTALALTAAFLKPRGAEAKTLNQHSSGLTPVFTPNNISLPFKMINGVKEFHLIAEEVECEFAPGMKVKCWGYNGSTPGPTIEAVEGDRVRFLVTNRLPEHTTIHWHGLLLPNGMDGVGGLNQPQIAPGETYVYEFTLRQHGTQMYHPHADEMVQMALGMMGMFIIHPKTPAGPKIDRDFVLMTHEWAINPGTFRPDPSVMLDFNIFTINGKVYPATFPLIARTGDRVRIRFGNLSMDQHPMHLHGFRFLVTGSDGGPIPASAQWPMVTVPVPVGATRDIEFIADAPGDWALHCHKSHHTMNAMTHGLPNPVGADLTVSEEKIQALAPGYMAMGSTGMADDAKIPENTEMMEGPENTLPMMMGQGPFGPVEMGGMFTLLKVRDRLSAYDRDPGWYKYPKGSRARKVKT